MFPLDLWQCVILGSCALIALGVLLFGFACAWGLRNDLQSWRTTLLFYSWVIFAWLTILCQPVFCQVIFLTGLWLVGIRRPWNSRVWLQRGLLLSMAAWGIGGYLGYRWTEGYFEDMRAQYPMVSLAERIPRPPWRYPESALPAETLELVSDLERGCASWDEPQLGESLNRHMMRTIHERNRRGILGVGTIIVLPMLFNSLYHRLHEPVPEILQPREPFPQFPNALAKNLQPRKASEEERKKWNEKHADAVLAFVDPFSFGYVRDIDHVAGFEAHRFRYLPKSLAISEFGRLELVSLLLHEKPVIYQSKFLPRMDEIGKVPMRLLDAWESKAFEQIVKGENLLFVETPDGMRMMGAMGAIRNATQCIQCHGGERGDLLGAFVYSLIETK